jgi:hypothetical protein
LYIKFGNTRLNALGLAFVSKVSLSTLGVVEYFHGTAVQGSCDVIDYLSYPTLVGPIHLNNN